VSSGSSSAGSICLNLKLELQSFEHFVALDVHAVFHNRIDHQQSSLHPLFMLIRDEWIEGILLGQPINDFCQHATGEDLQAVPRGLSQAGKVNM